MNTRDRLKEIEDKINKELEEAFRDASEEDKEFIRKHTHEMKENAELFAKEINEVFKTHFRRMMKFTPPSFDKDFEKFAGMSWLRFLQSASTNLLPAALYSLAQYKVVVPLDRNIIFMEDA